MVTYLDHQRIVQFLMNTTLPGRFEFLAKVLNQFSIIEPESVPRDLVTMNSEVIVHDFAESKDIRVKLVYHYSERYNNQVTILSSLGIALLGMRVGETKSYGFGNGEKRKILVKDIVFQPESQGRLDL